MATRAITKSEELEACQFGNHTFTYADHSVPAVPHGVITTKAQGGHDVAVEAD